MAKGVVMGYVITVQVMPFNQEVTAVSKINRLIELWY